MIREDKYLYQWAVAASALKRHIGRPISKNYKLTLQFLLLKYLYYFPFNYANDANTNVTFTSENKFLLDVTFTAEPIQKRAEIIKGKFCSPNVK